MARHASSTLIGGFVVGAVALAVVSVALLGSGNFLRKRPTFVMFFSGSITGLSVGAPVEFKGVKVGEVTKIAAVFDPTNLTITIPVYVEFDPKSLIVSTRGKEPTGGDQTLLSGGPRFYRPLLEKGLKAQLEIQSIVTQQLYISIDFHPEVGAKLVGLDPKVPEIPTIPSVREHIMAALQTLPDKIVHATEGVERLVNAPETQETMRKLSATLRDVDLLVNTVRTEVKPLAASVRATSEAARHTLSQAEKTLAMKEGPPAEMVASITEAMRKASGTLDQLRSTLAVYERVAAQNPNVGYELAQTLDALDGAARSVRSMVDYLERHPEAVLKGRR